MSNDGDVAFAKAIENDIAQVMQGLEQFSPPVFGVHGSDLGTCAQAIGRDSNASAARFAIMMSDVAQGKEIDASDLSPEIAQYLPPGLPPNSKAKAGFICMLCVLVTLASCIDALEFLRKGNKEECIRSSADANRWMGFLLGMLTGFNTNNALKESGVENVRRAAEGRRLIGSASREKVRRVASSYRHLAREAAAYPIAEAVGLSPGTVRRYLSELFPGEKWDGSADTSQRDA
ncbi:hypothetical protein SAMN05518854_1015 [Variovorax sp. YR266]|uniref:winged helix-turn-helix domain-containing protein n=1 Tax=Variovorax sp. YR266 TaxID=1884386 RepID=UPI00089C7C67|nr:winged helix-turn-helix domain-containing protein [Variovorax sp. YR266]SDY02440.1 hypothetical protein SAMN05518854_1015 [Variovorax sp. YR266]